MSITKSQIDAIAKGKLSGDIEFGDNKVIDLNDVTLSFFERYSAIYVKAIAQSINNKGVVASGKMLKGVDPEVSKDGNTLRIYMANYYDFVNKGVKGFKSGQPNSPYSFKSAYPSMNGPMVTAIQKWVKRNALSQRNETQKYKLSKLQKKRKSVAQLNTGRTTAYLIARKIKQRGLPKTGFFDNAVDQVFNQQFYDKMGKAVGADLVVYIKQANSLINKENQ